MTKTVALLESGADAVTRTIEKVIEGVGPIHRFEWETFAIGVPRVDFNISQSRRGAERGRGKTGVRAEYLKKGKR